MWKVNFLLCLEVALKTEKSKGLTPYFCVFRDGQSSGRCLLQKMPAIEWSYLPLPTTTLRNGMRLLTDNREKNAGLSARVGIMETVCPAKALRLSFQHLSSSRCVKHCFVSWVWLCSVVLRASWQCKGRSQGNVRHVRSEFLERITIAHRKSLAIFHHKRGVATYFPCEDHFWMCLFLLTVEVFWLTVGFFTYGGGTVKKDQNQFPDGGTVSRKKPNPISGRGEP